MTSINSERLFEKQNKRFRSINNLSKAFIAQYCGNMIIRDSIFEIMKNYAMQSDESLEVLRYPFDNEDIWAFSFVKKGTIFVCVNSEMELCRQIFAAAHELYHIYCYIENINADTICNGSVLSCVNSDKEDISQEDMEANAFAGLMLAPDSSIFEEMGIFSIDKRKITVDNIIMLMDLYAVPYEIIVQRLYENEVITKNEMNKLINIDSDIISSRIEITGLSSRWQECRKGVVHFGSLSDVMDYNIRNGLVIEQRRTSDRELLDRLKYYFESDEKRIK